MDATSSTSFVPAISNNDDTVVPPVATAIPNSSHSDKAAKIVEEFTFLLEKSQQLFAGLRDLPPIGSPRLWQPYFQRTFDVYTKLWKFQQQHRTLLENKEFYGLKRWEVGEIASKVGQLYYHYYLRTSETNYLLEAFVFYEAIRERGYFRDVLDEKNPSLTIKKLRFYARFVVTSILLNKRESVPMLLSELRFLVDEYGKIFKSTDVAEWNQVLKEIHAFLTAEKAVVPADVDGVNLSIQRRHSHALSLHSKFPKKVCLQQAVIMGNYPKQVKFSELTVDMYRMLQVLEVEPIAGKGATMEVGSNSTSKRFSPQKYLLFKPSVGQLLLYLSSAFKETDEGGALLLYLSAKGLLLDDLEPSVFARGVLTSDNQEDSTQLFGPGDILPFTRKSLFLVVESDCSTIFKAPAVFDKPCLCLLSPTEYPERFQASLTNAGNLFTLFLHNSVMGIVYICQLRETTEHLWDWLGKAVQALEVAILEILWNHEESLEDSFTIFLGDAFLCKLLVRFILCRFVLSVHVSFRDPKFLPSSFPMLPHPVLNAPEIRSRFEQIVDRLKVGHEFKMLSQ